VNAYDAFAWFYDRYWAADFQQWEMPALDRLLLANLPPNAALLDLCCGTGHLAHQLTGRGFLVTGIDSSEGMLALARRNAPSAYFFLSEAHSFTLEQPVDAALCTFDSINHILDPALILASFRQIFLNLKPGGCFLFDCNTDQAYGERWNSSAAIVEPDHAFFLRGHFDPETATGHTDITMFQLMFQADAHWQRTDVSLRQRPWAISHLFSFLTEAGFHSVEHWLAAEDLDLKGHYGLGRVYIRAC